MSGLTLKDIAAHGHVRRWHTARVRRDQTLGEHVGLVAMIALHLGIKVGLKQSSLGCLLAAALLHDAPETEFGDIPSPGKRAINEAFAVNLDAECERSFFAKRGINAPSTFWHEEFDLSTEILRHADLLEAWLFYRQEGLDAQKMAVIQAEVESAQGRLSPALKEASLSLIDEYLREMAS